MLTSSDRRFLVGGIVAVAVASAVLPFLSWDGCGTRHLYFVAIIAEAVQLRLWTPFVLFFLNTGWFPRSVESGFRQLNESLLFELAFLSLVNVVAFMLPVTVLYLVPRARALFRFLLTVWMLMFLASYFIVARDVCM
jgi:hypothetical protein